MTKRSNAGRKALDPADRKTAEVRLRLPPGEYDRTHTRAARDCTSVPAVIRKALSRMLDEDDDEG